MKRSTARYYAKQVYQAILTRGIPSIGSLQYVYYEADLDARTIKVSYIAGFDGWQTVKIAKAWNNPYY